jgi:hypothetical protein
MKGGQAWTNAPVVWMNHSWENNPKIDLESIPRLIPELTPKSIRSSSSLSMLTLSAYKLPDMACGAHLFRLV